MTDTTHEAPERIWAWGWRVGSGWQEQTWQHEDEPRSTMEYVRADLVQAAVAAALTEAAVNLRTYAPHLADGPEHDVGYYNGYHTALNRILALIPEGAQAALDRVVAEQREKDAKVAESVALPMDGKIAKAQAGYMRGIIAHHIRKGGE